MNTPDIIIILLVMGFVLLDTFVGVNIAFGAGEPNTVIIFCEWNYNYDFVNCITTEVWYKDFEIIKEETYSYQISVQDYKGSEL